MGKYRILLLTITLAGVFFIPSLGRFTSVERANDLLAFAPTPYPTVSVAEEYTVMQTDAISSQSSRNIEVLSPLAGDTLNSSFVVSGNAKTKDNTVIIRLSDSTGNTIIETTATINSSSSSNYGPFEKIIKFDSADKSGQLDIFQFDTNNGRVTDIVTVPLNFK